MITITMTEEEARALLHCLVRSSAKGQPLTLSERVEERILAQLNKLK